MSNVRNILKTFIQYLFLNRLVFRLGGAGKKIYLTFDDGPDPVYTSHVLKILSDNDAKASFFLVGEKTRMNAEVARQISDNGHTLAGHTYNHKEITEMTRHEMLSDLEKTRDCIRKVTNVDTALFRPPRGVMNLVNVASAILSGYRVMHWSVTYSDYRKDSLDRLVLEMQSKDLSNGDILLLHDNNQYTVEALDGFIKMIKKQGYDLCALPY